ncbi:MAG: iron-containing alcohol dehydrogenase [Bacteroidota bacterium]
MKNFTYNIPTRVHFGKGQIAALANELTNFSSILITYGGGSIKKNGLFNNAISIIESLEKKWCELSGIEPNPRISSVEQGIELCKKNKVDFILAIGGGSVIDCSKAIAFSYYYNGSPWDFFIGKAKVSNTLPLGTILTLAATGSEMNPYCVLSNFETEEKLGFGHQLSYPKFSILDPEYTFSVPQNQTAAGIADIMSHVLEQYFCSVKNTEVQNRLCEAILRTVIKNGPIAYNNPANYEARAELLWAGSLALNGMLSCGKIGDWAVHGIEHELSAKYDITHGVGLAILHPAWMSYVLNEENIDKFVEYASFVWDVPSNNKLEMAKEGIKKTREFFNTLNLPAKLSQVNIDATYFEQMSKKAVSYYKNGQMGMFKKLEGNDILNILNIAK